MQNSACPAWKHQLALVGLLADKRFPNITSGAFLQVLAIETSERIGSIAALKTAGNSVSVAHDATLPSDERSAQSLIPAIESLLKKCTWTPSAIDLICVTTGPGSFTGLRIGVTTAKTLAYATGAKLVEVPTLATIAAGVSSDYARLWTIVDAQRQELFASCFVQGWQSQSGDLPDTTILSMDQWLEELLPGDVVCGPPLKKLTDRLPAHIKVTEPSTWAPNASVVGQLGVSAFLNGQTVDAIQLVPRYYRKSAAEEKADTQHQ